MSSRPGHPFRVAAEAGDVEAMVSLFAADGVVHSPVSFKPYHGREAIRTLLAAVFGVFEDFRYIDELAGDTVHCLVFRARVGDRDIEGVDLIRADSTGAIDNLTVMVRPLSATLALRDAVSASLASHSGERAGA